MRILIAIAIFLLGLAMVANFAKHNKIMPTVDPTAYENESNDTVPASVTSDGGAPVSQPDMVATNLPQQATEDGVTNPPPPTVDDVAAIYKEIVQKLTTDQNQ